MISLISSLSDLSTPSPWSPSVLPDLLSLYVSLERVPKKINLICANEILILGTSCRGRRLTAAGGKRSSLFLTVSFPQPNFLFTFIPHAARLRYKGKEKKNKKQPLAATYYTAKSSGTKIDK